MPGWQAAGKIPVTLAAAPTAMPLPLIDRYLLREILQTWGAVTLVLLLILLTNSLAYILGKVVEGDLAAASVLPLFLTNVTNYVVTLVPLGLYLGLLLSFGRLYADSEMAALGACGVGLARLYRPVMIAGVLAAVITAALTFWLSPWAKRVEHDIAARMAARSELAGVTPGRFNRSSDGRAVLFAEERGDGGLSEVFVEIDTDGEATRLIRAESAVQRTDPDTGWRFLEFREGYRYSGEPGSEQFQEVEFAEHGVRVPQPEVEAANVSREGRSMTRLWNADDAASAAELQWRLALPLACVLLALAAPPLSHTTPRQGRYGKVAIALVIYLLYSNVLVIARDAVADGSVPPWLGMWGVHGLTFVLVALLIAHRAGWRWTRTLLLGQREVRP